MKAVCRAITFINYHIPLTESSGIKPQYSTVGFFDGMFTERLEVNYEKDNLKSLWRYTVRKTAKSQGKFSYQNIFGFSEDSWNYCKDEEFWKKDSDSEYPLLFVVFLQLSDYMAGDITIEQQCRAFNGVLHDNLKESGKYYTYGTIDKNDFVVCIRCRNHTRALNAIKELHKTESRVVYSYSVLSVLNDVLDEINEEKYPYFFDQYVDSICLKGITNSFNPDKSITLDQRYYEFCDRLIDRLYPIEEKEKPEEERAYRIYDILGDDDFRLIAREVNLGKLLKEFGGSGLLGDYQGDLRFYLYSSSLVLNTKTEPQERIEPGVKRETMMQMDAAIQSPLCEQLSKNMTKIIGVLNNEAADEKVITYCQALWQLLQSLKVLESAPVKKYDFFSLYHPFAALVRILENKLDRREEIRKDEIYEFIHKISMTLHGTLRTDIQFFQIRDFNVIVHYAPAKLRAFYALWALELSKFYNSFEQTNKKYSFILSPGVFGETHVKQLFVKHDEPERLMLITTPERNLYIPQWLSVIIAHEVSHFVGTKIRERKFRHKILLRLSAHIAALEMQRFWYIGMPGDLQIATEKMLESAYLRNQLKKELVRVDEERCGTQKDQYLYHSDKSKDNILNDYRDLARNDITRKIIYEYGERLRSYLFEEAEKSGAGNSAKKIKDIQDACNEREEKVLLYFVRFQQRMLPDIFEILYYICKETFADIIAVLTLNLSPAEYVMSFARSEYQEADKNPQEESTRLLPIRISVTLNAVKTILHKNKAWLENNEPELIEAWAGEVFYDTIFKLENNSDEQNIMVRAYGYKKNLTVKKKGIRNYSSMYDPEYGAETFSINLLDFLNDINVYKLLCLYMNKCADTYFAQIKEDDSLKIMRKKLLGAYSTLRSGTMVDIMQMIETFLREHE